MPASGTLLYSGYGKDSVRLPLTLSTDTSGRTDGFVAKYASSGQRLWTARVSCAGTGNGVIVYDTATDSTGAIYATGQAAISTSRAGPYVVFYNADGSYATSILTSNPALSAVPFLVKYNASGIVQWAAYIGSTGSVGSGILGYAVAVDSSNAVYMTGGAGVSSGVITAYNASGTAFGTTFTSAGATDAFLVKYNSTGTVQWLARVSSLSTDAGRGLVVDSTAVYMTGSVASAGGTVTAYSASGTAFGTTFTSAGSDDAVVVKYNLTGTVQWMARVSTTAADVGYGVALDGGGNLFVVGQIGAATATAYNANGTAFATTLTSIGLGDSFVVKYNSSGTVQWVAKMGTTQLDRGHAVATDSGNNAYIAGRMGAATFTAFNSNNTSFATTLTSQGSGDVFLVKYNATGSVQWVAQVGGTSEDYGYALVSDTSDNVYVLIYTNGIAPYTTVVRNSDGTSFATLTLTTNQATCLVKYNSSGTAQFAVTLNSATIPYALSRDTSTNLIAGGQFTSYTARNLGPSASVALTLPTAGGTDAMLVKYTTNGTPRWAARIASTESDIAYAVATDTSGAIYVVGTVGAATGTAYSADGTAFATTIPASSAFLVKYSLDGAVQWVASFLYSTVVRMGVAVDSAGNVYVAGVGSPSGGVLTIRSADGTTLTQTSASGAPALLVKFNSSGIAQWLARIATSNTNGYTSVVVDSSDAIIVSGYVSNGGVVFNADGTAFATITTAGGRDAVVVKFNSSGAVQWVGRMGSAATDTAYGVACDTSGNIYVAGNGGSTTQAVSVFNANGTTFTTLPVAAGGTDGYVVKYNASGTVQWATRFGSADNDIPYSLLVDSIGSLHLAGYSTGTTGTTVTFYNPDGTTSTSALQKSGTVGFLVKYTLNGVVQWTIRLDGGAASTGDQAFALAVDRRNMIYTGGLLNTAGAAGIITDIAYSGYAPTSAFNVLKFTPYGLLQWHQAINGTTTYPITYGLATDFNCDVIVAGQGANAETTNIYAKA